MTVSVLMFVCVKSHVIGSDHTFRCCLYHMSGQALKPCAAASLVLLEDAKLDVLAKVVLQLSGAFDI